MTDREFVEHYAAENQRQRETIRELRAAHKDAALVEALEAAELGLSLGMSFIAGFYGGDPKKYERQDTFKDILAARDKVSAALASLTPGEPAREQEGE